MIFLEKFGQPTAKGSYPTSATPEEKTRLLAALQAVTTDSGVILPEGMAIELLEAARSGTADYTALYDRMNAAISKVVLGHTGSSDATPGRLGGEDQAHDVRQDLVKSDADLVCESFNNGPARWLTEWNFPGAALPRVWRQVDEGEDLSERAEVDKKLHEMGYEPVSIDYINDTYGGTWQKKAATPTPALPPQGGGSGQPGGGGDPAQFAEGDTLVDAQAERLARDEAAVTDKMIDQIRAAVDQAQSLEQLREALMALYPALDTAEFASVMQQALAAAALAGRYEVLEALR